MMNTLKLFILIFAIILVKSESELPPEEIEVKNEDEQVRHTCVLVISE